jgi:hypothetical protein
MRAQSTYDIVVCNLARMQQSAVLAAHPRHLGPNSPVDLQVVHAMHDIWGRPWDSYEQGSPWEDRAVVWTVAVVHSFSGCGIQCGAAGISRCQVFEAPARGQQDTAAELRCECPPYTWGGQGVQGDAPCVRRVPPVPSTTMGLALLLLL